MQNSQTFCFRHRKNDVCDYKDKTRTKVFKNKQKSPALMKQREHIYAQHK